MQRKLRQQEEAAQRLDPTDYAAWQSTGPQGCLTVTLSGLRVVLRKGTPDVMVALSCLGGEFEPVRYLLPRDYSGIIIDAGAYIGTAALALSQMFPAARVIAVEPSEANFAILEQNTETHARIEIVHGALVAGDATSIMLKNRGTGEWGFTAVAAPRDRPDAGDMHAVRAVRLRDLVGDVSDIGLLKIDIEGGERELFLHEAHDLGAVPTIFVELHDRIVRGCKAAFLDFSQDRIVVKAHGEKYLSIRR